MNKLGIFAVVLLVGGGAVNAAAEEGAEAASETILAQPADAGQPEGSGFDVVSDSTGDKAVSVTVSQDEDAKDTRPFGVLVVMDHAFGSGNFVRNAQLRERADLIVQSWSVSPYARFDFMGHSLKADALFAFELELTTPDSNPARRIRPQDAQLRLSDAELYVDGLTDIKIGAQARVYVPTSYESINAKEQWSAAAVMLTASRTLGPVSLMYSFMPTKYFNSGKVPTRPAGLARLGEGRGVGGGTADPVDISRGFANASFALFNGFTVGFEITEQLSISYALMLMNAFKYDIVDDSDPYSAPFADKGRGRVDMLWPTLELSYGLNELLSTAVDLPFNLSVAAGITAMHPAQSADNNDILWPVFYPAFAQNRAANNYGSFYVDVIGVY